MLRLSRWGTGPNGNPSEQHKAWLQLRHPSPETVLGPRSLARGLAVVGLLATTGPGRYGPEAMGRVSKWAGIGAAVGIAAALLPLMKGKVEPPAVLARLQPQAEKRERPDFPGLDLMRLQLRPERVLAPLAGGKIAELTLDPGIQRAAVAQMARVRVPEGGVVLMEVATGRLLAYASFVGEGEPHDVNVRADAPAASVFKVVTGATLVERAGLNQWTEQCYRGGMHKITADELKADPSRDKWCATMGMAMGRSLNVVFARLAQKHLTPEDLTAMGGAFGFGAPVPFDVPNEASKIEMPQEPVEFARASAGFFHTTLSPLAGVSLAQTVASGGVTLRPRIVASVHRDNQVEWQDTGAPIVLRRAIRAETAAELQSMMLQTVSGGSAQKAFVDRSGKPFLPKIDVAGKTGTLERPETDRLYTWFVGFAPADRPEVAVSALVVNNPTWHIKAPELARNVLRAYFASKGRPGVTAP
jgi:peptidoglycan glycosyltransferase